MKSMLKILVMLTVVLGAFSCNSDDNKPMAPSAFTAILTGAQETPANASTAAGYATLSFDNNSKKLSMTLTYSGLTPTSGHIHKGATGVAGDIVFPLTITPSPIVYTSPALTSQQESDLKAGNYYVNLHTDAYPNGEIRGQIIPSSGGSGGGGSGGGGGGY